MKGAPWFAFCPADFLGGTAFMSAEEVGCYMRLLCLQWQTGGIPNDPAQIERVTGAKFTHQVAAKFHAGKDGILRNRRLEEDRKELVSKSDKAKKSAATRWSRNGLSGHANALRTHCEGICETDATQQCERNANHNHNHIPTNVGKATPVLKLDGVPVFPTKDGPYEVPLALAERLHERFPKLSELDIVQEVNKAYDWMIKKDETYTRRGMPAFFGNWMEKAVAFRERDGLFAKTAPERRAAPSDREERERAGET